MSKQQAPTGMYTSKQARELLRLSPNVFYAMVRSGIFKKVVYPGRKEGFYPKQQVDNYARQIKAVSESYISEELDFGLALVEDLPSVLELVSSVSGGPAHAVPEETLKAWIRKNPRTIHVLRRRNEVVGYVSGFILPMETLLERMDGTKLNAEIPIDDIQSFDPQVGVPFYIAEMAVKHSQRSVDRGHPIPDAHLGQYLMLQTAKFILLDLRQQGVIINELYAVGSSKFGISLCRRLGMEPLTLAKGVREDRMPCKARIEDVLKQPLINRVMERSIAA